MRYRLLFSASAGVLLTLVFLASTTALSGDTTADHVVGQPNFSSAVGNNPDPAIGGLSAKSLWDPIGTCWDAAGNLYVADTDNNRVLEYNTPLSTDFSADRLFGQPNFTSNASNNGGISASSLFVPVDCAVDAAGNLYVADNHNNRVLKYNTPLSTDSVADCVFGQGGSFATNDCNKGGVSADSLCAPNGLALDGAGNLYVGDSGAENSRVLEFDTPCASDTRADHVFGQEDDFTTGEPNKGGIDAGSLNHPAGVATYGDYVYISDYDNSRVLWYYRPLTTDRNADGVIGQPDYVSLTCNNPAATIGGLSAKSLCQPYIIDVDAQGNLLVSDFGNNRVLSYYFPPSSDKQADVVFGQGGSYAHEVCNRGGISANSLCAPMAVEHGPLNSVWIGDHFNHRVLGYDAPIAGPVGGVAEWPEVAGAPSGAVHSGGANQVLLATAVAAIAGFALALAGGVWYARRRWLH